MRIRNSIFKFTKRIVIIFLGQLLLGLVNPTFFYAQEPVKKHAPNLYMRAPDVIPGTLPEMRKASYWIDKMENPNQTIMNLGEIDEMNINFQKRMANVSQLDSTIIKRLQRQLRSRPGLVLSIPNLENMSALELSSITRKGIKNQINFLKRGNFGNILGIEYSESELEAFEREMFYDNIDNEISLKYGIAIADSRLRIIPSLRQENIGLININKTRWDIWNLAIIPIGSSVQILHISESGGYLFVLSEKGYGWIKSEMIALGSKSEIKKYTNSKNFVVAIGEKVPFYSDSTCTYVSGWCRMAAKLPIKNNNPRLVLVPTRQLNGELSIQEGWLKPDADMSLGYLPYTRENVVLQSIKLLDYIYDWTGGWYGRNHGSVLSDIFHCFGFKLPSNGVLLSVYTKNPTIVSTKDGLEAQNMAIMSNEPFITIQVSKSGHSQLYLGNLDKMPIVLDTHGYGYTDESGNDLEIRRCVIGTVELPDYFLKQDITFIALK